MAAPDIDLVRLATALQRRLAGRARAHGVRWSALMALGDLQAHGPLGQRQLAARQGITPATVSLLVRELHTEGLVEETPDPRDARRRRLRLTAAGAARLAHDHELLAAGLAEVLAGLHADERPTVSAAIAALLRVLA